MASQRKKSDKQRADSKRASARRSSYTIRRVAAAENAWELVAPPEAVERAEDLAEVREMIDAGEFEVARDELRWLLDGFHDLLDAHRLLGELALEDGDHKLGRAHFGYAFKLGLDALPAESFQGTIPYTIEVNQAFLESGKGLAWSLQELGKHDLAREIWGQLLRLDPSDPLGAAGMLSRLDESV